MVATSLSDGRLCTNISPLNVRLIRQEEPVATLCTHVGKYKHYKITHMHTHTHTHRHTHTDTHMQTHTYRHTHTDTHIRTHTCRQTCTHADTHTCRHTHMDTHMQTHTLYVTGFGKTVLNRTFCISRNINLKY